MGAAPRISCLTITRDRVDRLKTAVEMYVRQTWPNKELVVVVDRRGPVDWVEPFFASLGRSDVRFAVPPAPEHLGALRNHSVEMATGEIVATWDDDDWYHPMRLETQARAMLAQDAPVSFLVEYLQYLEEGDDLFLGRCPCGLAPSLVSVKSVMPRYSETLHAALGQKGSDTRVNLELTRNHKVAWIQDSPHLYTYVSHGSNVWHQGHHVRMAFHLNQDVESGRRRIPGLAERLREYFPRRLPEAVVCGGGEKLPLCPEMMG